MAPYWLLPQNLQNSILFIMLQNENLHLFSVFSTEPQCQKWCITNVHACTNVHARTLMYWSYHHNAFWTISSSVHSYMEFRGILKRGGGGGPKSSTGIEPQRRPKKHFNKTFLFIFRGALFTRILSYRIHFIACLSFLVNEHFSTKGVGERVGSFFKPSIILSRNLFRPYDLLSGIASPPGSGGKVRPSLLKSFDMVCALPQA